MFEIGKWYTLTTIEDGSRVISPGWKATKEEGMLVEFRNHDNKARLLNVASPVFAEAVLSENQSDERPVISLNHLGKGTKNP